MEDVDEKSNESYRELEREFHREIMSTCRKYINQLNLVSIIGTLDMAKHETIELVRATKREAPTNE